MSASIYTKIKNPELEKAVGFFKATETFSLTITAPRWNGTL